MQRCPYCREPLGGHTLDTREMMYGTRQAFTYGICDACRSCWLTTPLDSFDLAAFYPRDYYSVSSSGKDHGPAKLFLLRCRGRHELGDRTLIGAVMHRLKPGDAASFRRFGITTQSRVLDVGCGGGAFLFLLAQHGLSGLRGCDPFLSREIRTRHVTVEKREIGAVQGRFDHIFFHHAFEHLLDPESSLMAARRLQDRGGVCVIRVPTTSSDAFDLYWADWVQLDPPRHITVPSRPGMERLAARCGYALEKMIDDSTAFQFWGSEQYRSGIPLRSETSWLENPARSAFTAEQIAAFGRRAAALNAAQRGDQTAFVLRAV